MKTRFQCIPGAVVVLASFVVLPACGTSKADQCTAVIATYNDVGGAMRKGFGDGTDPAALEGNAKAIDEATAAFAAVEVKDAKVKVARDELAVVFGSYTTNMKSMAGALTEANDPAKTAAASAKIGVAVSAFGASKTALAQKKQALLTECEAK